MAWLRRHGGSDGSNQSKEPAWAYPGLPQGRRLYNKRVHPGPQFLVGSSGQPLLPSAIPSTLSITSHQPTATSHRLLAIPILDSASYGNPFLLPHHSAEPGLPLF
jgi:hypothetical protein